MKLNLCLLSFAVLISGCGPVGTYPIKKIKKQTLHTVISCDPPSFDPRIGVDTLSDGVIRMLFTGLTYTGREGTTELALAHSYEVSKNGLTYTFFLKDTKWSDGTPLTAHDFVETWKGMLKPEFPAPGVNMLFIIKNARKAKKGEVSLDEVGIKAPDDLTLVVKLENPNPCFLDALTNCAFYPLSKRMRESQVDCGHYVGCGPFRLHRYKSQNKIVLQKNPHYWDAAQVRLDRLIFYVIKEEATALMMFEKGEIDWLGTPLSYISLDAVPALKKQGILKIAPVSGTAWLEFNTQKFPFNNVNIRKALGYAIDRQSIADNIMHTERAPSLALIPQILKKEKWHPYYKDNDQKKALELFQLGLKELGISQKEFPEVVLSYNHAGIWQNTLQAVQERWTDLFGIRVKIEATDWPTHFQKLLHKDFQVARFGWRVQYDDPANLLDVFKYKDFINNHTGWENSEYTRYLDESNLVKGDERWKYLEAAEQILLDNMPIIPISHISSFSLQKPYLKGVSQTSLHTVDFRWAYFEKS